MSLATPLAPEHQIAAIVPLSLTASEVVCSCGAVLNTYGSTAGARFGEHLAGARVAAAPGTSDHGLRARIEALIGGPTPPVFLSDRPNKIVRVQHRDDRLCATVTESMVRVSDIVAALAGAQS